MFNFMPDKFRSEEKIIMTGVSKEVWACIKDTT